MKQKALKAAHAAYRFSNSWTGTVIIVLFIIFFVAQAFRIPSGSMKDSLLIGDHLFAKKFAYGIPTPHIPFLEISVTPWTDDLHLVDGDAPQRGDIVIFRYPHNIKLHYVKRCVALAGDELFLEGKDLYLHPVEGDEYIRANYPAEKIVERHGKLWVKRPYADQHPGIHHDAKIDASHNTPVLITQDGRIARISRDSQEYMMVANNLVPLKEGARFLEENPIFGLPVTKVEDGHFFMMGDNRDHSNDSRYWGAVPYENLEGTPWFVYFSMDDNWEIRWDRMGKTPDDLEQQPYLGNAVAERKRTDKEDYGLY